MAEPVKIFCRNCHAKLDVSDCPPFEFVECPECGTHIRVPKRFDRYLLEKVCGKGGDSIVYRAIEPELARRVAVKIQLEPDNGEAAQRFINAARICGKLNHPGVIPVYNCGTCDGLAFMVMRYMECGDLERMLKHGTLPSGYVPRLSWIAGIVPALIEAKGNNIVHHDVKPGNIMVTAENDAKLGDWDLADVREPGDMRSANSEWVSPIYASPERIYCGGEDYKGDIFSLGVTLYELLSGNAPFGLHGSAEEIYERRRSMSFDPLSQVQPGLPPALSLLVTGMLEFEPANRPEYEEVRNIIDKVIADNAEEPKAGEEKPSGLSSWFRKK